MFAMYAMSQFASLSKYEIFHAYSSVLDPLLQGDSLQTQPLPFCSLPSCARLTKDTSCVASLLEISREKYKIHDCKMCLTTENKLQHCSGQEPFDCNLQAGKVVLIASVQETARLLVGEEGPNRC